jgi:hypothetical protein
MWRQVSSPTLSLQKRDEVPLVYVRRRSSVRSEARIRPCRAYGTLALLVRFPSTSVLG